MARMPPKPRAAKAAAAAAAAQTRKATRASSTSPTKQIAPKKPSSPKASSPLKSSTSPKPSSPVKEKSPSKSSPKKKAASSTAKSTEAQDEEPELRNKDEKSDGPKSQEFIEESDSDSDSESESDSNDTIPISTSKKPSPTLDPTEMEIEESSVIQNNESKEKYRPGPLSKNKTKTPASSSTKIASPPPPPLPIPSSSKIIKPKQREVKTVKPASDGHDEVVTRTTRTTNVKDDDEILHEGQNVFAMMDSRTIDELLDRINAQCSPLDNNTVKKRENAINWEHIAFSSYGARQCRAVWTYFKHNTRNHRIMSEVVHEIKFKFTTDKTFKAKLIESLPGFPTKPPISQSGFHCYNREQWDKKKGNNLEDLPNFVKFQRECREEYDAFPTAIKEKFEQQAAMSLAEYKRDVKEFYAKNPGLAEYMAKMPRPRRGGKEIRPKPSGTSQRRPGIPRTPRGERIDPYEDAPSPPSTPAVTYIQMRLNKVNPPPTQEEIPELKQKFYKHWKTTLSDRKRVKWIDNCIQQGIKYLEDAKTYQEAHPGYSIPPIKVQTILSVDELALWESANGKPGNPKQQHFEVFLEEFMQNEDNSELPEDEVKATANKKWAEMDWYAKEMFTMKFKLSCLEYRKQLQEFYSKLPEFLKPSCKKKIHKKFWKMLENVDKVPEESFEPKTELFSGNEEFHEEEEDESSRRPKKSKKLKRKKQEEPDFNDQDAAGYSGYPQEEDDNVAPVDEQEIPRKKKKKRHRDDHDELYLDKKNISPEAIQQLALNQAKKSYKHGGEIAYTFEDDFVLSNKPSSKCFPANNSVSKNEIYEAIRGIFDARQSGRKFTIYYYYAKFVAANKFWIDMVNAEGLEHTALQIIKTFLSLHDFQQEIFIKQSYIYHRSRRHPSLFPDEPKPPPKFAFLLYRKDVKKMKKRDPSNESPNWDVLPDLVQQYYVKKLYHETKLYMRSYDKFITSLTPSDFVEYALHQYQAWESLMYTKQSVLHATREFIFPFSPMENEEIVDQHDDPLNSEFSSFNKSRGANKNPFAQNKVIDKVIKAESRKNKPRRNRKNTGILPKGAECDSDNSDDEYLLRFSLLRETKDVAKLKLLKAEMYDYPLDDLLVAANVEAREERSLDERMKRISHGTQTTHKMRIVTPENSLFDVETQTEIEGIDSNFVTLGPTYKIVEEYNIKNQQIANKFQTLAFSSVKVLKKASTKKADRVKSTLKKHFEASLAIPDNPYLKPKPKRILKKSSKSIINARKAMKKINQKPKVTLPVPSKKKKAALPLSQPEVLNSNLENEINDEPEVILYSFSAGSDEDQCHQKSESISILEPVEPALLEDQCQTTAKEAEMENISMPQPLDPVAEFYGDVSLIRELESNQLVELTPTWLL